MHFPVGVSSFPCKVPLISPPPVSAFTTSAHGSPSASMEQKFILVNPPNSMFFLSSCIVLASLIAFSNTLSALSFRFLRIK